MGQVIPVVKEHINDICSPHFLAYVQRLVLSLTRQPGHSQEFSRFFYGQLSSILQDSLAKYEGRRLVQQRVTCVWNCEVFVSDTYKQQTATLLQSIACYDNSSTLFAGWALAWALVKHASHQVMETPTLYPLQF